MVPDLFDRLARHFAVPSTRRLALGALLGTAVLGTGLGGIAAKNGHRGKGKHHGHGKRKDNKQNKKSFPHCISPSGIDVNEQFDIAEPIVAPFCAEIPSGRRWAVASLWVMSPTFEAVPEEFEPAGDTPLEDFVAKFTGVKYVVDPGTAQEKTVVFDNAEDLFTGTFDDGFDAVSPSPLGTLAPLSVGEHVVDVFWQLSGLHCDGLGDVVEENCLPAGDVSFGPIPFTVKPGHN